MKVEFSAKAWVLGVAAGLAIVPTLDAQAWPGAEETKAAVTAPAEEAAPAKKPSFLSRLFKRTKPAAKEQAPKSAEQKVAAKPAGGKSEVMRQLEEMYRRNGRQMPNFMNDSDKAAPSQKRVSAPQVATKAAVKPAKVAEPQQAAPAVKPQPTTDNTTVAKKSNHQASQIATTTSEGKKQSAIRQVAGPLSRFFGRLRGGRNPNDERPKQVYRMSPADIQAQKDLYEGRTPEREYLPQNAQPSPAIAIVPPAPEASVKPGVPLVKPEAPKSPSFLGDSTAAKEPELLAPEAPEAAPAKPVEKPVAEVDAPKLPEFDPAVELPADAPKLPAAPAEEIASDKEEENPFAGLKPMPMPEDTAEAKPEIKPEADDSEAPKLPEPNEIEIADDAKPASDNAPEENAAPKSEHEEKLQKIAQRAELTGLKGFCPVVLRDERDLRDALPRFNSEFEGRIYNFSSEEALKKFEASPTTYAPAAGGDDVVLKSDSDEATQGTLDYAVWFKDRLYLFNSKDSLDTFVISPAKYAIVKESKK